MRARTNEIKVRLSDKELALLDSMVSKTVYSREAFIRDMLEGYQIVEAPPVDIRNLTHQLARIGTNLNMLTNRAFVNQFVDEPEIRKLAKSLWDLYDDIRGIFIPYIRPDAKEEHNDE